MNSTRHASQICRHYLQIFEHFSSTRLRAQPKAGLARSMAPIRCAIATQGTRGDFQPVLSLGIGLKRAGHVVKFFANPGHCKMANEFGLESVACCIEVKDVLSTERGMRAMEKGDLLMVFAAGDFDDDLDLQTDWSGIFQNEMEEFKPDVLIWTGLMGGEVSKLREKTNMMIPEIIASYQPHSVPTNHITPVNMQRLELEPGQPLLYTWVLEMQTDAGGNFYRVQEAMKEGVEVGVFNTPQASYEIMFNIEEHPTPRILAYSPGWWVPYDDWPKTSNILVPGNWKIPKEQQEEAAKKGSALFNAGDQHTATTDFILAGEKPVYIGWGSMMVFSKEHMARLAVGALKEAGKRGIIVGGWAELSESSLGGDEAQDLKDYSQSNVLFLKSAPHEWLFPQCACCVHHGGIGTTQASLSAGVPTIVTPVFADQKDIARKLSKDQHGEGTVHLSQLTAKELGAKIRKCCEDPTIIQNCKTIAEVMAKEDGIKSTVDFIENFKKEVDAGIWKKKRDALEERLKAAHNKFKHLKDFGQIFGKWNMDLSEKYPPMKQYMADQINKHGRMVEIFMKKKLWFVKSAGGCLARTGEALKSEESGRYKEFAMLEEVGASKNGSRIHVKRVKGIGPDEGWVSPVVSGKDIVVKVASQAEIGKIQMDAIAKQFSDILGENGRPERSQSGAK